jgi:hypothetical protein
LRGRRVRLEAVPACRPAAVGVPASLDTELSCVLD